jgi:hypothetical protein
MSLIKILSDIDHFISISLKLFLINKYQVNPISNYSNNLIYLKKTGLIFDLGSFN